MQRITSSLLWSSLVDGIKFYYKPSSFLHLLVLQLRQVVQEFFVFSTKELLHRGSSFSELFVQRHSIIFKCILKFGRLYKLKGVGNLGSIVDFLVRGFV